MDDEYEGLRLRCAALAAELRTREDLAQRVDDLEVALKDTIDVALGDGREPMDHARQMRIRIAQRVLRARI